MGIYAFRVKQLADFVGLPHSVLETQEMLEQLRLLEDGVAIKVLATKSRCRVVLIRRKILSGSARSLAGKFGD